MTYHVTHTKRKTLSIRVTRDAKVEVRAPLKCPDAYIQAFVDKKRDWIMKHVEEAKLRAQNTQVQVLDRDAFERQYRDFSQRVQGLIKQLAQDLNVKVNQVTFRDQKTRWGSCSSKGNISLNLRLCIAPVAVADYVVIHELCHMVHMNHSDDFWNLVSQYCPEYRSHKAWLKSNGSRLMDVKINGD